MAESNGNQPAAVADSETVTVKIPLHAKNKAAESAVAEGPTSARVGNKKQNTTKLKRRKRKGRAAAKAKASALDSKGGTKYPKDALAKCLRIPQGILDQNAGNECTDREAAAFAKIGWGGPTAVEISSTLKYGLLE